MREIAVGSAKIGSGYRPFVIAEMSGNHNQSLDRALAIVDAAADAGAHALKIQTYTADTMTLDLKEGEFRIDDPESLWAGRSLYELYQEAHTPWEWHEPIFKRCSERGLVGFGTPFDATAVDFLESIGNPIYKIASFENTDIPLIRKVAAIGKPMIISTGMASVSEIDETIRAARDAGCDDIILLKCTSAYPADPNSINLKTIPHLRELFDIQVGLSDHTMGLAVSIAAVVLGATVVEKHFTLARADGGVDSAFSLEPHEMKSLVEETETAWKALGKISYGVTEKEKKSLQFRRSLYVAADMKAGDVFTEKNLRAIRPGSGLPPKYYDQFLGKRIAHDTRKGTPVSWELLG
ncbi:MAG: pseudaminic acid synthase [Candidatus Zixiibacteriota bacterium]|nr:MAG: pseudaminic acid synthase [candidate division Zixibacteria bacterium]